MKSQLVQPKIWGGGAGPCSYML